MSLAFAMSTASMQAASTLPVWPSFRRPPPLFDAEPHDRLHWRRALRRCLLPAVLAAAALPWLPRVPVLPAPARPVVVARLQLPPPAPEPRMAAARTEPATAAPSRVAQVVPEARRPQALRPPGERDTRQALATGVGLLALKQQLAAIHGAPAAVQLQAPTATGPGVGHGSGPGVGAGSDAGLPLRLLVTSQAAGGSGGVPTSASSRDSGGGGLAGRALTLVAGVAGGSGGGGPGGGGVGVAAARGAQPGGVAPATAAGTSRNGAAARASRSIEDIKLVFDRHKGAIHALYNRALRDQPTLRGKVVLELKIAPGGEVVDCRIVASELQAAELERQLLARVRQFDFGAQDVAALVVSWPVDFLPS